MQFPNNLNWKPMNVLKIFGLALVVIIILTIVFRLVGSSFSAFSTKTKLNNIIRQSAPAYDSVAYNGKAEMAYGSSGGVVGLSVRNVVTSPPAPSPDSITAGDHAEDFEVTEYNAAIETRHLGNDCQQISNLKSRADVIFENSNEYDKGCNYIFKVKHVSVPEILAVINSLEPKELNENTYTIKRLVDDYTSEVEILQKKITSIEKTLSDAVSAYDQVTRLATQTQNVESLAKIIDSKIGIIERLTQERININTQLERLARAKSEQLDRLNYTYFNVNIVENKFIDGQSLKDSWKLAVKSFVRDMNKVAQDITINLATVLFVILQYAIYLFIVLMIAKYGWRWAKYIWQK